jgi:predicted O-methyltransferase YrrM
MSLRHFLKHTPAGRFILIPYRFFRIALPYNLSQLGRMVRWALASKEHYNYTYDLTDLNRGYLASFMAVLAGHDEKEIQSYMRELEEDQELRDSLRHAAGASRDRHNSNLEPRYGRRLGWYALVRATKPRVLIETGVDRGLGTAVLAAAMRRNAAEGFPGLIYATDINPACGHLLTEPYKSHAKILLGDSVEQLRQFREPVDIFIHDSDHRPEYEWAELLAVEPRLHADSVVMSDNSQQSIKLRDFAQRQGRSFLYFQDQPRDHWWHGDGIGAVFTPGRKILFQESKAISAVGGSP